MPLDAIHLNKKEHFVIDNLTQLTQGTYEMQRTTQNGKKKKQVQIQGTYLVLPQGCVSHHLSEPPYSLLMSRNHGIRIFFAYLFKSLKNNR